MYGHRNHDCSFCIGRSNVGRDCQGSILKVNYEYSHAIKYQGTAVHVVKAVNLEFDTHAQAACGTRPNAKFYGWVKSEEIITCKTCLIKLK